ncbi:MAG: hemolysin family protein [Verrucomicrobiota bacterium]
MATSEPLAVNAGMEIMGAGGYTWTFVFVFFFVLLNGFFVAAEFSIVKVRSSQLDQSISEGSKRASLAKQVTNKLDAYLSATQLGITISSIALGIVGERLVEVAVRPVFAWAFGTTNEPLIHGVSLAIAFLIVTFLHVVLGELMPKSLAIRKSLPTTLAVSRPLHWFYRICQPAIWLFNGTANWLMKLLFKIDPVSEGDVVHSADELRILVAQSEKSEEVTAIEKEILINALALNDKVARDIMLPRTDVVTLDINDDFETNYAKALESMHTRLPLIDGHLDETKGLIHIKDLVTLSRKSEADLYSIIRPLDPVPEMMPVDKLLQSFLENKAHMALVVDEYGGSLGIVTLDNVLEELVGDIHDEFDDEEEQEDEFTRINDNEFEVLGTLPLFELSEQAGLALEDPEVSTVGGYVTHLIGHLPEVGEDVEVAEYVATVTEANGRSVGKLRFRKHPKPSEEDTVQDRLSA